MIGVVGDHHVGALARESLCDRLAYAGIPAGYDRRLIL